VLGREIEEGELLALLTLQRFDRLRVLRAVLLGEGGNVLLRRLP
jgi:hypothetical protein